MGYSRLADVAPPPPWLSVQVLGLGVAVGICAGSVCLAAFMWGLFGPPIWGDPECTMNNAGAAVFGVAVLCTSIVLMAHVGSARHHVTTVPLAAQDAEVSVDCRPAAVVDNGGSVNSPAGGSAASDAVLQGG